MSRFIIKELPMAGLKLVERQHRGDNRGFLSRLFCSHDLLSAGWCRPIAQLNHTFTAKKGTVRGMHYQLPPHAEMKLVSCIQGEILDVVVDLRSESPTFLRWHAEILSANNRQALLIPEGFAHGFQTLCDNVMMLYCHSMPHNSEAERALNPNDPILNIPWPLTITEISARDAGHPMISTNFNGVTF